MAPYFVKTYRCHVSRALAQRIEDALRIVDKTACFVRHYAAGNDTHGWIERAPSSTGNWRTQRDRELVAIADRMLGVK